MPSPVTTPSILSTLPRPFRLAATGLAALGVAVLAAANSGATPITIEFAGKVTQTDPATGAFLAGEALTGSFTYDSSSPDTDPATINVYGVPATGIGNLNGYFFTVGAQHANLSLIDNLGAVADSIRFSGFAAGDPVDGLPLSHFVLVVAEGDGNLIPDIDHPPLDPLPLIGGGAFYLVFSDLTQLNDRDRLIVYGTVTELRVRGTATPSVPDGGSTLSLLGLAGAGLAAIRRGHRNHACRRGQFLLL